jgi:hypothetical protein
MSVFDLNQSALSPPRNRGPSLRKIFNLGLGIVTSIGGFVEVGGAAIAIEILTGIG